MYQYVDVRGLLASSRRSVSLGAARKTGCEKTDRTPERGQRFTRYVQNTDSSAIFRAESKKDTLSRWYRLSQEQF